MSESDIDMDRCLLGIDDEKACVPEITCRFSWAIILRGIPGAKTVRTALLGRNGNE